jgi:hypothetical protein
MRVLAAILGGLTAAGAGVAARGSTLLMSVNNSNGGIDVNNIGIYRSTDTGATFVRVSGSGGLPLGRAFVELGLGRARRRDRGRDRGEDEGRHEGLLQHRFLPTYLPTYWSSSRIVALARLSDPAAPVTFVRFRKNVSFGSGRESSTMTTSTVPSTEPTGMVSVPEVAM